MMMARADAPICCEDWCVGEWWLYSAGSGRAAPGAGVWWPVRCASMVRGSGGVRDRVCGFMHRDEGRNIERQGRGEQWETLRSGINVRNATQRIGEEQIIPAFGKTGRCWKIWIIIDLTKLRQSFLSVLTI